MEEVGGMANIRKFLDLSTSHLPQKLMDGLAGFEGVVAYPTKYGAFMWVPDEAELAEIEGDLEDAKQIRKTSSGEPDEWPDVLADEIVAVMRYARSLGCDYVLFDQDAEVDEELPTWDW